MRVPYDEIAEEEVVGVVVGSRHGAGLVLDRGIGAEDFYKPLHRSLFTAVEYATSQLSEVTDDDERARIAAEVAGAELEEVVGLVRRRCVQWDEAGTFCRRVQAASRSRAAMRALADAFNALGEGAELEDVRPLVEAVL